MEIFLATPMDPLCASLLTKVREQTDRMLHLIGLLRPEDLNWRPQIAGNCTTAELLGHLLDCLAGFCAVLMAAHPERLACFAALRELPVNHACDAAEARARIQQYQAHIERGFLALRDCDLARRLPTVFAPEGQTILTLLLNNLEHLINHKYQLFTCVKAAGAGVGTSDLYVTGNLSPP